MKSLRVALLVFSVFSPAVFAQTVEQKEFPRCVEIISGTERHLQCENAIMPAAEQTAEKSLPGRRSGTAKAKHLISEKRKDTIKASKAAAKARPMGLQIMRDLEDSPEGPIISVAR